jgi:cytochrome P450
MTMILYLLLKNPQTMRKLRAELYNARETGRLSDPIKFTDIDKLEYLGAVIKETMRFKSFFRPPFERVVPLGGVELAGRYIPAGTVVYISQVNTSFDRSIWGRFPDAFRPERWLEADRTSQSTMERCMLGFGGGKRICLGRHIAKFEMKKVIPRLLLEFDVSLD